MIKLSWPVKDKYKVISCFWEDSKTSDYYKRFGWKHNGVDFAVVEGSNLYAIYDMTCTKINENDSGKWAEFSLNGLEDSGCLYGHLSTFGDLKVGQSFNKGDLLPIKSGNTGYPKFSSGPHCHLGVWIHGYKNAEMGNYTDPLAFFFEGETIEDGEGRAYFVRDNFKKWSPDLLTFYSYGLVPEDIQKMVDPRLGTGPYWTEVPKRIKDGVQMEYVGSVNERLFNSMRKNGIIRWG